MRIASRVALVVIAPLLVQGCISAKTYVDPSYGKARYTDIKPVATKYGLDLKVQFQRNGENLDKVNGEVQKAAERAVRATGVFDLDSAEKPNTLSVTINNVADMSSAVAKGFGTGLTFGLGGLGGRSAGAPTRNRTKLCGLQNRCITTMLWGR